MSPRLPLNDPAAGRSMPFRPSNGVVLSTLDDDFILFSEPQQRVYQLDPTSGGVWLSLSAGEAPITVARRIADKTRSTLADAGDYVSYCLTEWQRAGFFSRCPAELVESAFASQAEPASTSVAGDLYSIAGARIAISFPDVSSKQAWDAIAGHLRHHGIGIAETCLAIASLQDGYRLTDHSGKHVDFPHPAAVAVGLKEAILHAVLERQPHSIALHAAVLSSASGSSVLLAGPSGSGKTTLAGVLNAMGMPSIADDVALVSVRPLAIGGLPFAFAAKPGSWGALRAWFTALDELPEFQRPDGRIVKYIKPVRISGPVCAVSAVVFPRFSRVTPLRITPMRKVAGLLSLLEEAINASRKLTAESFVALSRLIDGAAVTTVEYDDVNLAAEWIKMNMDHAPIKIGGGP